MDFLINGKEKMLSMIYPKYILAHEGVYDDITNLIEQNIADKASRATWIAAWIKERGPVTLNDAEQLLWRKLDLHSQRFLSRIVFQRNTRCALDYLAQKNLVFREFRDGTEFFWT